MEATTSVVIPVALLTLSYAVTFRRSFALLSQLSDTKERESREEEEEVVEGEEDLIPNPEPLGGSLSPPKKSRAAYFAAAAPMDTAMRTTPQRLFPHEYRLPLDTDAAALRSKLIDADAAKRRAMTRLAELERETENLKKRCAELERKTAVGDTLHQLGITQKFLSMAMPQLKARRRVLWKA